MKIFIYTILFCLIFCSVNYAAIEIKDPIQIQKKLEQTKAKINKNQQEIAQKKNKQKQVAQDLMKIERNILYINNRLSKVNEEFYQYKTQIQSKESDIERLSGLYRKKNRLFKNRLVAIYKNKNLGLLEIFFTVKDLGTIIDYSYYMEQILKKDIQLITELKTNYELIVKEKKVLALHKERVSVLKNEISTYKDTLSQQQQEKNKTIKVLQSEIDRYERENASLIADSNQLTLLIQKNRQSKGGAKPGLAGTGRYVMPARGWISSYFGFRTHPIFKKVLFHTGIDIAAGYGAEVHATDSGSVIYTGKWGGYGNVVIIDHGDNVTSVYAHLSRIAAQKGDNVNKGALIAYVGSTGFSTGPHLHFEIRIDGKVVDPLKYLN